MIPKSVMPQKRQALRQTAKHHLVWRTMTTYTATYRAGKAKITVHSITEPPTTKEFLTSGKLKKFRRRTLTQTQTKVIIVARTKNRKKPVDQEELEELEGLEEIEDIDEIEDEDDEEETEDETEEDEDDETEDEDEDEDEDDDEEEEPAPKVKAKAKAKSSTTTKKSTTKSRSRAADNGKVGTQEVAAHFGVDSRTLRVVLRKYSIAKDEDSSRYEWSSLKHPEVIKIGKLLEKGAAAAAKKESLDKLKESTAKKGKTPSKSAPAKKTKKAKAPVEDEDEDDE